MQAKKTSTIFPLNLAPDRQALPSELQRSFLLRAKEGDSKAAIFLLNQYIGLVLKNTGNWFGDIDDLLQEGSIGLLKAIQTYDLSSSVHFSAHADRSVSQQIDKCAARHDRHKQVPINLTRLIEKIRAEIRDHEIIFGFGPSITQLAVKLRIDEPAARRLVQQMMSQDAWDQPSTNQIDIANYHFTEDCNAAPETQAESAALAETLHVALLTLTTHERAILVARFGLADGQERSLDILSRQFKISKAKVRGSLTSALSKLRNPNISRTFREFIDEEAPTSRSIIGFSMPEMNLGYVIRRAHTLQSLYLPYYEWLENNTEKAWHYILLFVLTDRSGFCDRYVLFSLCRHLCGQIKVRRNEKYKSDEDAFQAALSELLLTKCLRTTVFPNEVAITFQGLEFLAAWFSQR